MPLQSFIFAGDALLEACLVRDASHIVPGARGYHVNKIQGAVECLDDVSIAPSEWQSMSYGPSTAAAVLAYKTKRKIIGTGYQTQADDIVGKMTVASLDSGMAAIETTGSPPSGRRCRCRCGHEHRRVFEGRPAEDHSPAFAAAGMAAQALAGGGRGSIAVRGAPAVTAPPSGSQRGDFFKPSSAGVFDGFDPASRYQMVPLGSSRQLGAFAGSQKCVLTIEADAAIATFTNIRSDTPDLPGELTELAIRTHSNVQFSLTGRRVGRGRLVLRGEDGKVQATWSFSVKASLKKTIGVRLVSDNRGRTTTRTKDDASALLKKVAAFYKKCANLDFDLSQPVAEVIAARDLGDVIDTNEVKNWLAIFTATIRDVQPSKQPDSADVEVYFVWSIEDFTKPDEVLSGSTKSKFSFVEDRNPAMATFGGDLRVLAHEMGHAMQLKHNRVRNTLMFETSDGLGSTLSQLEIDTLNPSGGPPK